MAEDIRIRLAEGSADFESCVELQRAVWGLQDIEITSVLQLTATVFAGGLLHIAETPEGRAVGFAYAFPAFTDGQPHLHSDMLAVLPDYRKSGLGARLKWAQREDALRHGLRLIRWTFDPMQARNAHLNLRRLGALATDFLPNFYGITTASLHHGLPTDRLLVHWDLESDRVVRLRDVGERSPTVPLPASPRVNDVKWQAGWPVSSEPRLDMDDPEVLLEIPPEWDVFMKAAPRVAEGWQGKVRKAFQSYLARGYVAANFAPTEELGRRRPFYVLRRKA